MTSTRLTAILAAAALATTLTGCGEDGEPTVNPTSAEKTTTAPVDSSPTTGDTTSEDSTTSESAEPTTEDSTTDDPVGGLPTEAPAYADLFVQAWVDQDQELLDQLAKNPDVLTNMQDWSGQGWTQVDAYQEGENEYLIKYLDDEDQELTLFVQGDVTENGEPGGVVATAVEEGAAADLPTEPTAYGELFAQALVEQDQAMLEQLAAPDALDNVQAWSGKEWIQTDAYEEEDGGFIIKYLDEENKQLTLWVDRTITENGEPGGVVATALDEDAYAMPTTVEDYAKAFVNHAGGNAGDREFIERLATPEAAAAAQDWVPEFSWVDPQVSDGAEDNLAEVTYSSESGDAELVIVIDRELAEAGAQDAVLEANQSE